ncbi:hydroxysqualene dehydroxylase [Longimycelium tulufanense]|nr:FAD-dependent oxidoreductase [Longimycelium tulufanense]
MERSHIGRSTRRRFLLGTAGVIGAAALGTSGSPARAAARVARPTVAVLGGGVGGLSAAHELAERDFAVTVYERRALGGKARSIPVPGTGQGGRRDLPGEHGLRAVFGIYHNLPDTLRRIPFPGNANGVFGNLVDVPQVALARSGGREDLHLSVPMSEPAMVPATPEQLIANLRALMETAAHLPPTEALAFANRMFVYLTSCDERRLGQWEHTPWWDFIRAEQMSEDYRRLFGSGATRLVIASRPQETSAHTVASVAEAFFYNIQGRGSDGAPTRILNLPTNEAWIDPWETYLRGLGVRFHVGWTVRDLVMDGGRVAAAEVTDPRGDRQRITADFYVCAMPIERARAVWNDQVLAADPRLVQAATLPTEWMTGIQYYLRRPAPILPGHVLYIDSPWALVSVSQAQFWPGRNLPADYGDGTVAESLSVVISDWDTPGPVSGKPARELSAEQVAAEAWTQLKDHLNDTGRQVLTDADLVTWFLDPAVTGLGGPSPTHEEPLLIHPVGSWQRRPSARTAIPNLVLAADYVATNMNLATMEGANEAAREAVNAILDAMGSSHPRAPIRTRYRPPELDLVKEEDLARYRQGLPNRFDTG